MGATSRSSKVRTRRWPSFARMKGGRLTDVRYVGRSAKAPPDLMYLSLFTYVLLKISDKGITLDTSGHFVWNEGILEQLIAIISS